MSSAAEVLAQHQYSVGIDDCTCVAGPYPANASMAAHQLDALKEAGFISVHLPTLAGVAGSGNGVWLNNPYIEQRFDGEVIISDRLAIAANELRAVAAALLAAAVQHEQDDAE